MPPSEAARDRRILASLDDGATPDAEEQEELALKIRYGIGVSELLASSASEAAQEASGERGAAPAAGPGSAAARRWAVQRLGRGHGLGRRWGG